MDFAENLNAASDNLDAPDQSSVAFYKSISFLLGLITIGLGLLVLVGWMFDIQVLKRILPVFVTMKANTAFGFIFAGCSLALISREGVPLWARPLSISLAAATGLLGLLTVCQNSLNVNFGIDQLIFQETAAAIATNSPGRMAPGTSFNFILIGCALILAGSKSRVTISQWFALVTGILGILPLIGYLFGATSLLGFGQFTQMAVHTATLFITLGIGVLLLHPTEGLMRHVTSRSAGGWLIRTLLPIIIVIPFVFGWLQTVGERAGHFSHELGNALLVVVLMILLGSILYRVSKTVTHMNSERLEAESKARMAVDRLLDITRKKKADEAVKESEERYRSLYLNTPVMLHSIDTEGRLLSVSNHWVNQMGYSREEVLGRRSTEFLTEESRKLANDVILPA